MSVIEPWGLDAGIDEKPEYTGLDFRAMMSGLLVPGDRPLSGRSGVLVGMETNISGNTLTVNPGICIVNTMTAGSYWSGVKETMTLPVSAAHATYNRRDLLICQIEDIATSGRGAKIKIIPGTPSASPSTPGTPNNACAIATLTVPSSGSISVTPSSQRSALAGGIKGATSQSQANALTVGASPQTPVFVWRSDLKKLMVNTGSGWKPVVAPPQYSKLSIPTTYVLGSGWGIGQLMKKDGWVHMESLTFTPKANRTFEAGVATSMGTMIPEGFRPEKTENITVLFMRKDMAHLGYGRCQQDGGIRIYPQEQVYFPGNNPGQNRLVFCSANWRAAS